MVPPMIQYPSSSHKTYECNGQLYGHPPSPGIDPQAVINPIFKVVSQAFVYSRVELISLHLRLHCHRRLVIFYHRRILSPHSLNSRQLQKENTLHYRPCPSIHRKMTDIHSFWLYLTRDYVLSGLGTFIQRTSTQTIHCYVSSILSALTPWGTLPVSHRTQEVYRARYCDSIVPPGLSYHTYPILVVYLVWLGVVELRCTFTHICNRHYSEACKPMSDTGRK
jgi:hypothetical protein